MNHNHYYDDVVSRRRQPETFQTSLPYNSSSYSHASSRNSENGNWTTRHSATYGTAYDTGVNNSLTDTAVSSRLHVYNSDIATAHKPATSPIRHPPVDDTLGRLTSRRSGYEPGGRVAVPGAQFFCSSETGSTSYIPPSLGCRPTSYSGQNLTHCLNYSTDDFGAPYRVSIGRGDDSGWPGSYPTSADAGTVNGHPQRPPTGAQSHGDDRRWSGLFVFRQHPDDVAEVAVGHVSVSSVSAGHSDYKEFNYDRQQFPSTDSVVPRGFSHTAVSGEPRVDIHSTREPPANDDDDADCYGFEGWTPSFRRPLVDASNSTSARLSSFTNPRPGHGQPGLNRSVSQSITRQQSDSDESGFSDWAAGFGVYPALHRPPKLEAHALGLSASPRSSQHQQQHPASKATANGEQNTNILVTENGATEMSPSTAPGMIKRRLKAIVQTIDAIKAGNRKSLHSNANENSSRPRIRLQRSSSDPEGLGHVSAVTSVTIDLDDDEFGFRSSNGHHSKAVRHDVRIAESTGTSSGSNGVELRPASPAASSSLSAGSRESGSSAGKMKKLTEAVKFRSTAARNRETGGKTGVTLKSGQMANGEVDDDPTISMIPVRIPTSILQLTEDERLTLQKVSLAKLHGLDLGCTVVIPTGGASGGGRLRKLMQLKKYVSTSTGFSANGHTSSSSSSSIGIFSTSEHNGGSKGLVFGIPLDKCLSNEAELSSTSYVDLKSSNSDDNLIDALSLSHNDPIESALCHRTSSLTSLLRNNGGDHQPAVPHVIRACCQHIQTYGLHVPGIFRIAGQKSRVNALREEFDTGQSVRLTEDHSVHDVASLLKEFLRELPDCLLTGELYPAFLATASIEDVNKRVSVLRLLVSLLPPANRDALWSLLTFLGFIARYADDSFDAGGLPVPGNKMDSSNLATVFAPNLLHRSKSSSKHHQQTDAQEMMNRSADVVAVVKDLIDFHAAVFRLSRDLYNDIINTSVDKNANLTKMQQPSPSPRQPGTQRRLSSQSTDSELSDSRVKNYKGLTPSGSVQSLDKPSSPFTSNAVVATTQFRPVSSTTALPLPETNNPKKSSAVNRTSLAIVTEVDKVIGSGTKFEGVTASAQTRRQRLAQSMSSFEACDVGANGAEMTTEAVLEPSFAERAGTWQSQRWQHWEHLTDQYNKDSDEHTTLV